MPDPMYRRIAEDLRQKIESGDLGHGTQLPTELELRDRYDASRNTVRDAVRWLITRGLVETRPGQGTFVVEKIDPFITTLTAELETGLGGEGAAYASEVTARSRRPTVTVPRVEIQQAAGVIARELRLDGGQPASAASHRRYRLFIADHVLPDAPRRARGSAAHPGPGHARRYSSLPRGNAGHQANRLPRHDYGTSTGRYRGCVLQAGRRRPHRCVRDFSDRLRRAGPANAADGQRLPHRPESIRHQRRPGA